VGELQILTQNLWYGKVYLLIDPGVVMHFAVDRFLSGFILLLKSILKVTN